MAIPIIMVVGAAVAAYGAYQQGQAQKKAANFNAAVQRQNAEVARTRSVAQSRQIERENVLRLGMIRANQGASGGQPEGSVLDVIGDVAAQGELDRQDALYRGELVARGYANTEMLDRFGAKAAGRAGTIGAASELFKGVGSAYGSGRSLSRT